MATSTLVIFNSADAQVRLVYDNAITTGIVDEWTNQCRIISVAVENKTGRRVGVGATFISGTRIGRDSTSVGSATVSFPGTRFMNAWDVAVTFG